MWPTWRVALAFSARSTRSAAECEVGGDRLFDENVDAGIQEIGRHFMMVRRRDGNRDGVDLADQGAMIGVGGAAIALARRAAAVGIDVDHPHQLGPRIGSVVTRVMRPEIAEADHADTDLSRLFATPARCPNHHDACLPVRAQLCRSVVQIGQ